MTASSFDICTDAAHLRRATLRSARGKRSQAPVAEFLVDQDQHLARIQKALIDGSWRPAALRVMRINDPKPRSIAVAPFADRVVHTAVADAIAPRCAPSLTPDDFACRPGFGTHRAVLRLQHAMRRHRFAVHLDVKAYFPSVDLDRLRRLLARRLPDPRMRTLLDHLLDNGATIYRSPAVRAFSGLTDAWPPPGRGLAIGSAVSQYVAAHVYLNAMDHWIKRSLRAPAYVRYVDDLFIFANRREDLRVWRAAIGEWLAIRRGLRLKHPNARILHCAGHLDGLGYRISRSTRQALPRTIRRLKTRVRQAMAGTCPVDARRAIASAAGVICF